MALVAPYAADPCRIGKKTGRKASMRLVGIADEF
jgi:hypothetical protein